MADLAKCPFCRSTDIRHHASGRAIGRRFKCMKCHAEGPPARFDLQGATARETERLRYERAASLWNTRAIAAAAETLLGDLDALLVARSVPHLAEFVATLKAIRDGG